MFKANNYVNRRLILNYKELTPGVLQPPHLRAKCKLGRMNRSFWGVANRSGHEDTPVNMLLCVFMQKGNWGTSTTGATTCVACRTVDSIARKKLAAGKM